MLTQNINAEWHRDGHHICLMLEKDQVVVSFSSCPFGRAKDSPCWTREAPCVVEYFINLYGLEGNVGVAPAEADMEIAWSLVGDEYELDRAQCWWIPVADEIFSAFAEARS